MGKLFIRFILAVYVFLYRRTGGKLGGNLFVIRVLLLTTTGRKTGKKRTTPMGYIERDGIYLMIGLFAMFVNANPGWFYNLRTNPSASVQVKDKQFEVNAEIVGLHQRDQVWAQVTEVAPFYAKFAKRTSREIPLVILRPAWASVTE